MKKTIAVLFLLCTLLGLLASCKDDKTPIQTQDSETGENKEISDNLPSVDMDGFEIRFYTNNADSFKWAEITIAPETDITGVELHDAMYERNSYIEERFDCAITVTENQSGMITQAQIQNFALGGDTSTSPHVIMCYDKWVMDSVECFRSWGEVPYISVGEEYWNPGLSSLYNINGKQMALSGSFALGMLSRTNIMVFNKYMYEQYFGDVDSMYDLVYKNEWTIEKLYELAAQVMLSQDDVWDETDQVGITASKKELYTTLMVGCGIHFVQPDESNTLKFTLPSDAYAKEKMEKLLLLNQDNDIYFDTSSDIHTAAPENMFEEGRSLFAIRSLFSVPTIRAMMEQEFGILPVPKYNSEQQSFYSIAYGGDMACLMMNVKDTDLENIGIIMEALTFESQQTLIPLYKYRLLKTRFASDVESSAMLDIVFETTVSDFGINALEDTITVPMIQQVFAPEKNMISSMLSGLSSIHRELSKLLEKIQ